MPKSKYVAIEDLPKTARGQKPISEEFIKEVQAIPEGYSLEFKIKLGTATQRIKTLKERKILSEQFKVTQRKTNGNVAVYIAHLKP